MPEDFKDILEKFCAHHLKEYGVGIVTAELQNLAAFMLSQCDDREFREEAVKSFEERVHKTPHFEERTV